MTTNPSHILIARNSRSSTNPSASLSSPTETHAAASGIFRSTGSPPWLLEEREIDSHLSSLNSDEDEDEGIEIDNTFTRHSPFPGGVKIVVEGTTFWLVIAHISVVTQDKILCRRAHKEVLYFASPFFQAALSGNWSETGRPSSVITIPKTFSGPQADLNMDMANHNPETEANEMNSTAAKKETDVLATCQSSINRQVDREERSSNQRIPKYIIKLSFDYRKVSLLM